MGKKNRTESHGDMRWTIMERNEWTDIVNRRKVEQLYKDPLHHVLKEQELGCWKIV